LRDFITQHAPWVFLGARLASGTTSGASHASAGQQTIKFGPRKRMPKALRKSHTACKASRRSAMTQQDSLESTDLGPIQQFLRHDSGHGFAALRRNVSPPYCRPL
jgi:hypothetical protein